MDARDWPVEELRSYLQFQIGLDEGEVGLMSEASVRELVLSLNPVAVDNPLPSLDPIVWPAYTDQPTSSRPAGNDAAAQPSPIHSDEITHDQMLSSFCEITSSSEVAALELLEACAWNFDTALAMHMDGVDSSDTPSSSSQPQPPTRGMARPLPPFDPLMELERMRRANPNLLGAMFPGGMMSGGDASQYAGHWLGNHDDDDDDNADMDTLTGHYELEHGVRRPDPTRRAQLLGGGGGNDFSRADEPGVEWLFPPPRQLSFPGTFQEARTLAKSDKKWVLVNIQAHTEFDSHKLNRDTWVDDTVQEIVRENMLFWQRGHTSADARTYMGLYNISEADLPHIGIIDPRTGSKTSTIKGYIDPRMLTQTLFEFFDENSFDSTRAAREGDRSVPSTSVPILMDDDDEDEATFIQAYDRSKIARREAESIDSKGDTKAIADSSADVKADAKSDVKVVSEVRKEESKVDYGPVPVEPVAADGVRISIKLVDGKSIVRRYLRSDPVRSLFAVTSEAVGGAATRGFELLTTYPKAALSARLDDSLEAAGLAGAQVVMQWI